MRKLTKGERMLILLKYGGRCAYCGEELLDGKFHADHINPIVRNSNGTCNNSEYDVFENYNPACPSCNIQKNSFTIEQFRENIKNFVFSLNKYSTQYKFAKKYGLIIENDVEVKFYYEQFKLKK